MKQVLILLSSYNGEKYISEQIDSILSQENVNIKILVRDDGSTDSTPQILERYKQEGKLEYYIGENVGWEKSFLDLILHAPDNEYYAFSDQDDYWMPNKLYKAIECIETLPEGIRAYVSNTYYWRGETKIKMNNITHRFDAARNIIWMPGPGCTMLFNQALVKQIKERHPNNIYPHDKLLLLVAILCGNVYYDTNAYILYRQHGNNQLGGTLTLKENFKRRYNFYSKLYNYHCLDMLASDLLDCYSNIMNNESYDICYNLANYRKKIVCFLKVLFLPKFSHESLLTTLGFKSRVLVRHI